MSASNETPESPIGQPDASRPEANSAIMAVAEDMSMNRIIDFLKEQQRTTFSKDTEYIFEKQQLMTRNNQLTA